MFVDRKVAQQTNDNIVPREDKPQVTFLKVLGKKMQLQQLSPKKSS